MSEGFDPKLLKAESAALGGLLLEVQQECITWRQRAERAEAMLQQVTAVADALLHGHAHIGLVSAEEIVAQAKKLQLALAADLQPAEAGGEG